MTCAGRLPTECAVSHCGGRREEDLETGALISRASPELKPAVDLPDERLDDSQSNRLLLPRCNPSGRPRRPLEASTNGIIRERDMPRAEPPKRRSSRYSECSTSAVKLRNDLSGSHSVRNKARRTGWASLSIKKRRDGYGPPKRGARQYGSRIALRRNFSVLRLCSCGRRLDRLTLTGFVDTHRQTRRRSPASIIEKCPGLDWS